MKYRTKDGDVLDLIFRHHYIANPGMARWGMPHSELL